MTRLDARPDSLDVSFRPGSTVTLNLNGPAGWLTSRSFTATLNGTSLSVSEDDDTLVVVASSGVTTALGSLGAKYPLVIHQSGGNDQIIGTWTASDGPALSRTVDATVLVDTIEVGVTILGSGTGGGGGGGVVDSVVAGTNVTVDSSDPANPIVSATGGGGGAPSGPAGGVLGGTYPNPSFAADMATQAELDTVAAAKENVGVAAALVDDLSGVTNHSQARTNLGLGTAATTAATAYATAAQGAKADTAVQPGSLASVATSGAYADLSGKPTLGSAAAASTSDFDAAGAAASAQAAAIAASQPVDSDLTAIAALTTTTFGRALLTQADAAATRTTLGLGTAATTASTAYDAAGAAAAAQAASQPLDSDLTAIAALTTTSYGRAFLALADAAAARTALGLGTAATTAATAYATAAQGATADSAVQPARTITAGTGLTGGGSLAADRTLAADFGAAAGKVTQGNDARLSDARTPTAHASSHAAAGGDPVTLTQSQITGLTAALAAKQTQDSDLDEIAALTDPTTYRNLGNNAGTWGFQRPAAVAAESHSTTSISNSTTETTLADLIIPGGSVAAGDLVRLSVWGDVTQSSGGAVTFQWRLKIGSTTVGDTSPQSVSTASGNRKVHLVVEILMESTTAERIAAFMNLSGNTSGTWAGNGATFTAIGAAAEDTATDKHVLFTVQMATASASAGVNVYGATLEIIKKRDLS